MNKIERAIIMAAGKGSRLLPITLKTPKPLIKVNGTPMIETIINALNKNNIYEIYIVVGYKKEKFNYLKRKYKNINIIDNPYYENSNNISSLYVARDYIENTFIIDGDQIIENEKILSPQFEKSGYLATWTKSTNEWLLNVKNNEIIDCNRNGGKNGYRLYSVSMWTKDDGKKLKNHIEIQFSKKNNQVYWDDVPIFIYKNEYDLGIRKINCDDLFEVDSYSDLIRIDSSYIF